MSLNRIVPDWPAPQNVRAFITTREGGVSQPPFASLNLGDHVGDDPAAVAQNRALVRELTPAEPLWLKQVHGTRVVDLATAQPGAEADACVAHAAGQVCVVMTADCLPALFCDRSGTVVAAAHAGWRGLLDGVLEAAVAGMHVPGSEILAYLGPAIGAEKFEVGDEVRAAFVAYDPAAAEGFIAARPGKWLADIYLLARQRLAKVGVQAVYGGTDCTVTDAQRFYSYRRDGQTGRMAALVWLE